MTKDEQAEKLVNIAKQFSHSMVEEGIWDGVLDTTVSLQVVPELFVALQRCSEVVPECSYYPDKHSPSVMGTLLIGEIKFTTCYPFPTYARS